MPEEVKTETPPTEPPKPLTADEMRASIAAGVQTGFETVLKQAQQNQPAASAAPTSEPPEPTTDDIDKQIDEAIAAGQPISALQRKRDEIVEQRFERRMVRPLREQGATAISSLAADSIVNKPYYQKLKPTIERLLASAPKGTLLTKEHYEWAYNQARGQHADELEQIAAENAIRKSKEPPQANPPDTAGRTATASAPEDDENADFTTVFGKGTAAVFKRKNQENKTRRTEDEEAQMMGFADRKDMMKARRELEESEDFSLGLDK